MEFKDSPKYKGGRVNASMLEVQGTYCWKPHLLLVPWGGWVILPKTVSFRGLTVFFFAPIPLNHASVLIPQFLILYASQSVCASVDPQLCEEGPIVVSQLVCQWTHS